MKAIAKAVKSKGKKKGDTPANVPPPAKVDAANLPVMEKELADLPKPETDPEKIQLLAVLLSPAGCTEKEGSEDEKQPELLQETEIISILQKYVDGVDSMYDRTGNLALTQMFCMTYQNGLPIYNGNPSVQQHTILAMKTIFAHLNSKERAESWKRKILAKLCDAFRACQAEQGRVIDSVYGTVTGRDKSFREQVLMVVDVQKELVLENLVNKLNPNAWKQGDDIPQKQVPHITSSYRVAVGKELGLRGIQSALMDHCRFQLPDSDAKRVAETFKLMFSIDELCDTLVADVNQQSKDADRLVSRDDLGRWAGNVDENNGFNSHSIFYDEDAPDQYKDLGKPLDENLYQPFLNRKVAFEMLKALFLDPTAKKSKK